MNSGTTPAQVAYDIAASAEREAIRVRADYQNFLGRAPSQSEVNNWVAAFGNGLTNEGLVAGFLGSPEYYNNPAKGKGDNLDWIKSAYQDERCDQRKRDRRLPGLGGVFRLDGQGQER